MKHSAVVSCVVVVVVVVVAAAGPRSSLFSEAPCQFSSAYAESILLFKYITYVPMRPPSPTPSPLLRPEQVDEVVPVVGESLQRFSEPGVDGVSIRTPAICGFDR